MSTTSLESTQTNNNKVKPSLDMVADLKKRAILENVPESLLKMVKLAVVTDDEAIFITDQDEAYVIGDNRYDQLGLYYQEQTPIVFPQQNVALSNLGIVDLYGISSSKELSGHSRATSFAAVTHSGRVHTWGFNESGQLGVGNTSSNYKGPHKVTCMFEKKVIKIAGGLSFVMCLTDDGGVYTWGSNASFRTGVTDGKEVLFAHRILFPANTPKIIDIAIAFYTSLALTESGQVYGWGDAYANMLGNAREEKSAVPILINIPTQVKIVKIACGTHHCVALDETGALFTWGNNSRGQLGISSKEKIANPVAVIMNLIVGTVTDIAAGEFGSYCMTSNGGIYAWGDVNGALIPTRIESRDWVRVSTANGIKGYAKYKTVSKLPGERSFKEHLLDPAYMEVSFEVDGEIVKGHKLMLERCQYFKNILSGDWKPATESGDEAKAAIKIKDFRAPEFSAFVKFLHTDEVEAEEEQLLELLRLADYYQVETFRDAVEKLAANSIKASNAMDVYSAAIKYNSLFLEYKGLAFMANNFRKILLEANFDAVDPPVLCQAMKELQKLNVFKNLK